MVKDLAKSIIVMMVAFVCVSANAQSVNNATVDSLTQSAFEALKADKVASKNYYFNEGNSIRKDSVVRKKVGDNVYEWTYTSHLARTTTQQLSLNEKEQVLRDEKTAFAPSHKTVKNQYVNKPTIALLGGVSYADELAVVGTVEVGYEMKHITLELDGSISREEYPDKAEAKGHYDTFAITGSIGLKVWQSLDGLSHVEAKAIAGFGRQMTDTSGAQVYSSNYGGIFGGAVRGTIGISKTCRIICEGGYKVLPHVEHGEGTQKFSHAGFFGNIGLGLTL